MHRKKCKRLNIPGDAHELTFSCFNQQPFFDNEEYCWKLIDSINRARGIHDFHLWAYVIMPEHVHLLIWPQTADYSISNILTSIKLSVSKSIIGKLKQLETDKLKLMRTGERNRPYRFWMAGGAYDRNMDTQETLMKSVNYIHNNPVKRGLVENPEDWTWSSYRAWNGLKDVILEIDIESFPQT